MKYILLGLMSLLFSQIKAQHMNTPHQAVTDLFVATDARNWSAIEHIFDESVLLDYSSFTGQPAATLTPADITTAWKGVLPGFESTHHQVGNFQVTEASKAAQVSCYGTASHHLPDDNGNVWLVVGTYDFELVKDARKRWRISSMKFNFKYQEGNGGLVDKAIALAQGKPAPASNKDKVRAFFKALEDGNIDQLVALFASNGRQVNPYASGIFPEGAEGKDAIRKYWEPVFPNFDGMQFPITAIYSMEDPTIVFVEYDGKIKLKDNQGYYKNHYYSTFKCDEAGLIVEYVEIFNPITAAKAFGLLDNIK